MTQTNLRGSKLSGADLRRADLRRADLREAGLDKTTLGLSVLSIPHVLDANLESAYLRSESDLITWRLQGAIIPGYWRAIKQGDRIVVIKDLPHYRPKK